MPEPCSLRASVLTITQHHAPRIGACTESVLGQTRWDWQRVILVVAPAASSAGRSLVQPG